MVYYKVGDLVNDQLIQVFCHQTNCFKTMGAGIAKQIAETYPDVARRDSEYHDDQLSKYKTNEHMLGTILPNILPDKRICINMYAQYGLGRFNTSNIHIDSRPNREKYFKRALREISVFLNDPSCKAIKCVGFPKYIGCGIAGGNWGIYEKMIEDFSKTITQNVCIVELESK